MNCLDAETLAAWMDGGLMGSDLAEVQAHVAGCDRCQMLLGAMARTRAAVPPNVDERTSRRWLAWAVPLAAAATAIAVWVAIPQQRTSAPEVARRIAQAPKEQAVPPPSSVQPQPPAAAPRRETVRPKPVPPSSSAAEIVQKEESRADTAQGAPAVAPAAPAPQRSAEVQRDARARATQNSAVTSAFGAAIEMLCGQNWTSAPADVAGQLAAGSSPSANVCWVVGRGGLIRRSADGQSWETIRFPEMTDLSGVQASDARTATVTTADGRSFRTSDGGVSWVQR